MLIGFSLAAYSVIANDSAQTLGTFIASNSKKTKWYWMWAYASIILICTMYYGYLSGDIAHGRLNKIPLPDQFHWYHALAPALLLCMTRFGIPASTTLLTLSVFSSEVVLGKIIIKSAVGYGLAAISAYLIWTLLSKVLNERTKVPENKKNFWRRFQWISTGFLWFMWLSHDIANVFVFLPRGDDISFLALTGIIAFLVIALAHLFATNGGKIQEIVLSKSGTRFVRSACLVDLFYALILWYFKYYNDLPMSTTWVFIGLLSGRELAVHRIFNEDKKIKVIFPMLVGDFLKIMLGLALSVALVVIIVYLNSFQ